MKDEKAAALPDVIQTWIRGLRAKRHAPIEPRPVPPEMLGDAANDNAEPRDE